MSEAIKCPICHGTGRVADPDAAACDPKYFDCETCSGRGVVTRARPNQPVPGETESIIAGVLFGWSSENPTEEARNAFASAVIQALKEKGFILIREIRNTELARQSP